MRTPVCSGVRWAPELNLSGVEVGDVFVQDGIALELGMYDLGVEGPHLTVVSGADVRLSGPTITSRTSVRSASGRTER